MVINPTDKYSFPNVQNKKEMIKGALQLSVPLPFL